MKPLFLIVLSCIFCAQLLKGQHTAGTSGLLNTPSADFNPDGTFSFGANLLPQSITPDRFNYTTGNYFINITYFSFLELTYRMTLLRMPQNSNRFTNQDRSMAIRIRLLKESNILPSVVLGSNDFLTSNFTTLDGQKVRDNQFFGTFYAVATKNIPFAGRNNLGLTLGYSIPIKETAYGSGFLAGIRYNPSFYPSLSLIAEYDAMNFNLGASALLFNHIYLQAFTSEFKDFSFGVSYRLQLKTYKDWKPSSKF